MLVSRRPPPWREDENACVCLFRFRGVSCPGRRGCSSEERKEGLPTRRSLQNRRPRPPPSPCQHVVERTFTVVKNIYIY
jgi:hypothetical protein